LGDGRSGRGTVRRQAGVLGRHHRLGYLRGLTGAVLLRGRLQVTRNRYEDLVKNGAPELPDGAAYEIGYSESDFCNYVAVVEERICGYPVVKGRADIEVRTVEGIVDAAKRAYKEAQERETVRSFFGTHRKGVLDGI